MNFVAIDFETANSSRSSVCTVGLIFVENGQVVNNFSCLVRPKELYFDEFNSWIHGITEDDVKYAPEFPEVWATIWPMIKNRHLIAHNASFDMSVLRHVLLEYELEWPELNYSCTRVISRRTWPGLYSYSLDVVSAHLGISFKHHVVEEDALACAKIACKACEVYKVISLDELAEAAKIYNGKLFKDGHKLARMYRTPHFPPSEIKPQTDNFDHENPFCGKLVVFTGTLNSMTRKEAMQKVINLGGRCSDSSVTESTSYLVVGVQDFRKLKDGQKSNKMRRAEQLLQDGFEVEIVNEDDFLRML